MPVPVLAESSADEPGEEPVDVVDGSGELLVAGVGEQGLGRLRECGLLGGRDAQEVGDGGQGQGQGEVGHEVDDAAACGEAGQQVLGDGVDALVQVFGAVGGEGRGGEAA
ncbi:hypothetical protein ACFW7J_06625 [Streptomyces sp. NPDC059525]|uniref:hypothetical protein n=1 Tax=Streptomyces sp. NPDC059525 TaxID=3346857 RepID=UPI0036B63700